MVILPPVVPTTRPLIIFPSSDASSTMIGVTLRGSHTVPSADSLCAMPSPRVRSVIRVDAAGEMQLEVTP